MKKVLLALAAALTVYACTSDREEEVPVPEAQKEELIIDNHDSSTSRTESESDSIKVLNPTLSTPSNGSLDPTDDPNDPNDPEIVHPGDVKPPKP